MAAAFLRAEAPQHIEMFIHWSLVFFFFRLFKRGSTIDVPNPVNLFIYSLDITTDRLVFEE